MVYLFMHLLNKTVNDNCSKQLLKLFPEPWTNKTVVYKEIILYQI